MTRPTTHVGAGRATRVIQTIETAKKFKKRAFNLIPPRKVRRFRGWFAVSGFKTQGWQHPGPRHGRLRWPVRPATPEYAWKVPIPAMQRYSIFKQRELVRRYLETSLRTFFAKIKSHDPLVSLAESNLVHVGFRSSKQAREDHNAIANVARRLRPSFAAKVPDVPHILANSLKRTHERLRQLRAGSAPTPRWSYSTSSRPLSRGKNVSSSLPCGYLAIQAETARRPFAPPPPAAWADRPTPRVAGESTCQLSYRAA